MGYQGEEIEEEEKDDQEEVVRVLGKTLWYLNRQQTDPMATSLRLLGLIFWGKVDKIKDVTKGPLVQEIVDKVMECDLNDDVRLLIENSEKVQLDTDTELVKKCEALLTEHEGRIIENETELYKEWDKRRELELEAEKEEKLVAWRRTFPRRNWSLPGYFSSGKYVRKPGQEQKESRWERREKKRGPPK